MIFFLSKVVVYAFIVYQTWFVNLWVALGLSVCFVTLEVELFLLGYLKRMVDTIAFTQTQATSTDFSFSTNAITNEEADLVDLIRDGDLLASATFLKNRCENKLINFEFVPSPVRLILAQRLVNAINRGESLTWSELLSDNKHEKEVSI